MSVLANAITNLEVALLPLASALLLEELTYGGLVRLILTPKPVTSKQSGVLRHEGERKCSR
jgi:hypothetical protein